MSTVAELQGEIGLDPNPFIAGTKAADKAFAELGDNLTTNASKMKQVMDGVFVDSAGRFRDASGRFMTDAEKMAAGVGGSFNKIASSAGAMSVVIGNLVASAATKLAELGGAAIMVGINFDRMKEQSMIAFTNLLGSGQAAKKFLDELAAFAAKTPFEFKELTTSAQKLTAMGFAAKEVIPMMTAIGNAVSAMGGSAAQVDRVTTALTQMKAKGKVSAEEMMQLAEAGIPAWKILAESIGKSIPEAMKMAEKGAISADVAISGLIEGMQAKFGGMMDAQSQSFDGLMSTLRDLTSQAAGEIMQPLFDASKNVLQNIVAILPEFKAQFVGAFNEIVSAVSVTVNNLTPVIKNAMNDMAEAWRSGHSDIMLVTKNVWGLISSGFIEPSVGGIAKLISFASKAFAGDWEGAMRRMLNITDTTSNSLLSTVARWVQALARVSGMVSGLGPLVGSLSSMGSGGAQGPIAKSVISDNRSLDKGIDKLSEYEQALVKAGDTATKTAKALGGTGGAAKKGADEAAKAMRDTLQAVNEYAAASGKGVRISEEAWLRASPAIRANIVALKDEFKRGELATQEFFLAMKGGMLTTIPGLGQAFVDAVNKINQSATILAQSATPKLLEFIQPFKGFQTDIDKAQKGLDDSTKKIAKSVADAAEKVEKEAKKMHDAMMENFEKASAALPDSLNSILDAVLNMSGKAGDALIIFGTRVKEQVGGVIDVLGSLPGAFGSKLKSVIDTVLGFVNKIDSMLKGLHKIFNSIPDGLGGVIEKVLGSFKNKMPEIEKVLDDVLGKAVPRTITKNESIVESALDDMFGKVQGSAQKGMSGMLSTIGKAASAAAGILGGIGTFMGSRNQGKVAGVLGGAMGGLTTGASIGALFGPAGVGIGAGIGAAAGAILGLFGSGKSAEQKRAEEEAKQRAALDMQRAAADIMTAQMEGLKKGLELLEGLKTFSEVPRKAIKRFFNEIEMILTLFADMAGKFKADSLAASKALTDTMADSFGFLLSGADLINAIKGVATITDQNIGDFIATTTKIIQKWAEAASQIELQSAKITGKISDKLKTSFEFLSIVPDVIKGFAESAPLDDSILDSVFATAQKIVQKMKEMSEAERGLELNKAGASSGIFSTIFETTKSLLETFTQLLAYKPLEDTVLAAISSDLDKLLAWGDSLTAKALEGIGKFDAAASALAQLGASIRNATSGLNGLSSGLSGTGSNITANIQSQNGAAYVRGGGNAAAAPVVNNTTHNTNVTIQGNVQAENNLIVLLKKVVNEEFDRRERELQLRANS